MKLEPGLQIGEKLRLAKPLAFGGAGSVWVADHLTLLTQVAVKFLSEELPDAESIARFRREATLAAQIKSPHVVQIFDHGFTDDNFPYIVMELLEGEDLGARLRRVGQLSPAGTAEVLAQVTKALGAAHAKGFVHRDIKPENIFLMDSDGDLFVKVLDFGVAKKPGDTTFVRTSTGSFIGTPHYMSPEQVHSSRSVDFHADLWAVAVVLYQCLTGQRPFHAETTGALYVLLDYGTFAPPSTIEPTLGAEIDAFFARALHRDLTRRFGSARELCDAFAATARSAGATPAVGAPAMAAAATPTLVAPPSSAQTATPTRVQPLLPGHARTLASAPSGSGTLVMQPSFGQTLRLGSPASDPAPGVAQPILRAATEPSAPAPRRLGPLFGLLLLVLGIAVGSIALGVWWLQRGASKVIAENRTASVSAAPAISSLPESPTGATGNTPASSAPDAPAGESAPAASSNAPNPPPSASPKPRPAATSKPSPPPSSSRPLRYGF